MIPSNGLRFVHKLKPSPNSFIHGKISRMKNFDPYIDPHKIPPQGKITIAAYPPQRNGVTEEYFGVRWMQKNCLICKHFTAPRDLRQEKRYVVQIDVGFCRLGEDIKTCTKFEKIDELRGKNLTILQKVYFHCFTRRFLNRVVKWYLKNPQMCYSADLCSPKVVAGMVCAYLAMHRKSLTNTSSPQKAEDA